jgi:hypothetical protein
VILCPNAMHDARQPNSPPVEVPDPIPFPADAVQALDYASPASVEHARVTRLRFGAWLFACFGVAVALAFAVLAKSMAHWMEIAYPQLSRNPRAFGREVDPQTIASLRHPTALQVAMAACLVLAAARVALAVYLAIQVGLRAADRPEALRRLSRYARYQVVAAIAVAAASFFALGEYNSFVNRATRHHSVGQNPVFNDAVIAFAFELLPAWWARAPDRAARRAHRECGVPE